jgi:SAM-dependent methyltransferase
MVRRVLNVGGNNKSVPLPPQYAGWEHVLLDIDPRGNPDVVCDARELSKLPGASYDSIYCSHNLEHYHRHDVARVVAGFCHLLKPDGFVYVRVPDMGELMQTVVQKSLDIDDVLYQSAAGPITVRDVIYGYGLEIEQSGNDFYAHKTGFTAKSLLAALVAGGFPVVFTGTGNLEVMALALKNLPGEYVISLFQLGGSVAPSPSPSPSSSS